MQLTETTKTETPKEIQSEMNMWRAGFSCLPNTYITFHKILAESELTELQGIYCFEVYKHKVVFDGWMDGMRVLEATIGTQDGLLVVRWSDSSQSFMKKEDSGGWSGLTEADLLGKNHSVVERYQA